MCVCARARAHVMYTNEVLIFYRIHKNSNRELIYITCKSFNPINTHLHIFNLDTLIYLRELGDLAKSNLEIHFPAILSRMPLAEANLVIQLPTILSRMPLAKANLVYH